MSVFVVGDVASDILAVYDGPLATGSDTPAEIRIVGGGAGANTAAWLATTGVPVTFIGAVGADAAGRERLAELRTAGVRCAVRTVSDIPTGSIVVLSCGAERSMLFDRGANGRLQPSDVDAALSGGGRGDHLHLSGYTLFDPASAPAGLRALVAARALGMTTSVDAASAAPLTLLGPDRFLDWVRGADVLFANLDEAGVLAGLRAGPVELATALLPYSSIVIVKRGAQGAVWAGRDGARPVTVAALPVATVIDPTGAGDAFAAGFLARWRENATPTDALAEAARQAAKAITKIGSRP